LDNQPFFQHLLGPINFENYYLQISSVLELISIRPFAVFFQASFEHCFKWDEEIFEQSECYLFDISGFSPVGSGSCFCSAIWFLVERDGKRRQKF
jgi:hypothetical protein